MPVSNITEPSRMAAKARKNTLGGCMNTAQMVPSAQIIVSIIPIIGILMGGAILFLPAMAT